MRGRGSGLGLRTRVLWERICEGSGPAH